MERYYAGAGQAEPLRFRVPQGRLILEVVAAAERALPGGAQHGAEIAPPVAALGRPAGIPAARPPSRPRRSLALATGAVLLSFLAQPLHAPHSAPAAVRGHLSVRVAGDGRGLEIVDESGRLRTSCARAIVAGGVLCLASESLVLREDVTGDGVPDLVTGSHVMRHDMAWDGRLHLVDGATLSWREFDLRTALVEPRDLAQDYHVQWIRSVRDASGDFRRLVACATSARGDAAYLVALDAELREISRWSSWCHFSQPPTAMNWPGREDPVWLLPWRHDPAPALVILDPLHLHGCGPNPAGISHEPRDAGRGSHLAFIQLMRTDLVPTSQKDYVVHIEPLGAGRMTAYLAEGSGRDCAACRVAVTLDERLNVLSVVPEDTFKQEWSLAAAEGLVPPVSNWAAWGEEMKARLRWHDGHGWSDRPPDPPLAGR
jgi:hypothetical protein